ncbi:hypothetical protein [Roseovarius aquimarinus]|uniref:DUF4153 domain-containing protein n=1 Tax=Roseovarius aquimarinus TaxID=1229156 RepID=A0ABW7I8M7_9RHOB
MSATSETAVARMTYTLVGAVIGLCAYLLIEIVPDALGAGRLSFWIVSLGLGFFAVLLGLMGPVRLPAAAGAALALALPASLLFLWASFRAETPGDVVEGGYALLAYCYLLSIPVPFIVARLQHHGGWRHYGLLFDAAWELVVRIASAVLFALVVWAVLLLSDQLLQLVGLGVIGDLIALEPAPFVITGAALGLSLAIVFELRDYVSPFLVIQLLRVFLPPLLLVVAIFIAALPLRGLGSLFGQLSAAAILMGVTLAGVTLITTAVHRDDPQSVHGPLMTGAARMLGLLLVVPALLALWAVWLRVDQYGLTPHRVAALVAAGILSIYAIGYAGAVLRQDAWRAALRRINRLMALVTIGVAAAWLTPLLNAERLATASQLARAEAGAAPEDLPLWELAHEWGRAGAEGLAALEETTEPGSPLAERIAAARTSESDWDYRRPARSDESIAGLVPLRPAGAELPDGALDGLPDYERDFIRRACAQRLAGGNPGCVMVVGAFEQEAAEAQVIGFFMVSPAQAVIQSYALVDGALESRSGLRDLSRRSAATARAQTLTDIFEGRFEIAPARRQVLEVDDMRLMP